jgi:hypothetical protein
MYEHACVICELPMLGYALLERCSEPAQLDVCKLFIYCLLSTGTPKKTLAYGNNNKHAVYSLRHFTQCFLSLHITSCTVLGRGGNCVFCNATGGFGL